MIGANTRPMTKITPTVDGPSATRASVAEMTTGMARKASVMRISTSSTAPLKYPATSPIEVPRTVPNSVARGATTRIPRAPWITRDRTSRPSESVPKRWSREGGRSLCRTSGAIGSCGAIWLAKRAQATQKSRTRPPTITVGDRLIRRRRSSVASRRCSAAVLVTGAVATALISWSFGAAKSNARIDQRVADVGHERGSQIDDPDQHDRGLEEREIPLQRRREKHTPQALEVEHEPNHNRAAYQITQRRRDHCDRRHQRVAEHVAHHDRAPGQALQYCGSRVVGVQRLDHP